MQSPGLGRKSHRFAYVLLVSKKDMVLGYSVRGADAMWASVSEEKLSRARRISSVGNRSSRR